MNLDLPELLGSRSLAVLVLTSVRLSALVIIAPFFSSRAIPLRLRTVLALGFTLLLHPVALAYAASLPSSNSREVPSVMPSTGSAGPGQLPTSRDHT